MMTWIAGVEEAGRGPVIGPMAMAILWTEDEELLRRIGAKDSKQLTPVQREDIYEKLAGLKEGGTIGFECVLLPPAEIDAAVEGEHDNLNKLEQRTTVKLIKAALTHAKVATALIDCPTKNTAKYEDELRALLGKETITLVAENKADENYPVVGAASIIAKVTRDREVRKIKERLKIDLGSGYPADPLTVKFLRENWNEKEYAALFRKSWASYKNLAAKKKQSSLADFGADEERADPAKEKEHAEKIKEFEFLKEHGFAFSEPTNQYEVLRMKAADATIILYTTGKLLVQGKGKARAEKLLERIEKTV